LELFELQTEPASDTESQVNLSVQQPVRLRIYPLEQWLIAYQTLHQRVFYYLIDTSFCLKECLLVVKNSLKKILLLFFTFSFAIGISACGISHNSTSSKDILEKYSEATKNIKNLKFNSINNMTITSNDKKINTKINMDGTLVSEPTSMLVYVNQQIDDLSENTSIYLKDDSTLYIKEGDSSKWIKENITDENKESIKSLKNLGFTDKNLQLYRDISDKFKVEEQGDNYTLTYSGNDEKVIELFKKQSTTPDKLDNFSYKNITIKLIIKKSNYEPVEIHTTIENQDKTDTSNTVVTEMKVSFSEINKSKITPPSDIEQ